MAQTFTDYPKAAVENAKRALKFREDTDNKNGCGTPVGWARANQLAKREPISLDTVKRMAQFNRHRQNKDVPYEEGCGGLMWDAWGGTEGVDWAIRKVEQEAKNMVNYDILNDVVDMGYEVERLNSVLRNAGGEKIRINIASDGGEVFTGLKLAGLIEAYEGETEANIYGLAASIATVIALAADTVKINRFGFFMIHNAWGFFQGNKDEVRKQKKVLAEIDDLLADLYVTKIQKAGKLINGSYEDTRSKIVSMMSAETFLNAAKAIEMGLVDGYISEEDEDNDIQNKAIANVRQKATYYNKLPNQLLNNMDDKKTLLARFAEFLGFTKSDADEVLNTLPEAQNKAMEEEKKEEKEVIEKEEKEEKEDPMKAMEEKLKAMEDENKELKEQLKAMEEEKKKAESAKNELEAEISNSASYAKGGTESKSSGIFSKDLQDKFNEAFKNANFKNV